MEELTIRAFALAFPIGYVASGMNFFGGIALGIANSVAVFYFNFDIAAKDDQTNRQYQFTNVDYAEFGLLAGFMYVFLEVAFGTNSSKLDSATSILARTFPFILANVVVMRKLNRKLGLVIGI